MLHVVGGGVRNQLLPPADRRSCAIPVIAGPEEATALGNVLVQARAAGELGGSLAELREVAAASVTDRAYEPADERRAAETYARFLAVTGLAGTTREAAVAGRKPRAKETA